MKKIMILLVALIMCISFVSADQNMVDDCMMNFCDGMPSPQYEQCFFQNCDMYCEPSDSCYDFVDCHNNNCQEDPEFMWEMCWEENDCSFGGVDPCANGVQDGDEEGVDCGGSCAYYFDGYCDFEESGTEGDPYLITTCKDLYERIQFTSNCNTGKYYKVENDLDCSSHLCGVGGLYGTYSCPYNCGTAFTGHIDGNNKIIEPMSSGISGTDFNHGTIFDNSGSGASINNLKILGGKAWTRDTGNEYDAGGLVGSCGGTGLTVNNVIVEGVSIDLEDDNRFGTIGAGGICGAGTLTATDSYVKDIAFTRTLDNTAGGLLGYGSIDATNCYAITTNSNVYSGIAESGTSTDVYYNGGDADGSGATELTLSQMETATNFDFDFDVWGTNTEDDLPCLLWEEDCIEAVLCTPLWSCSGYGSCNISDLSPCNETTDNNICGQLYTGDYLEFSPQSCNYCGADWQRDEQECILNIQLINWTDLNEGSCCNITGLSSDCDNPYLNEEFCSMFSYTDEDIAEATLNTIIALIISFGLFISIVVIAILLNTGYKKIKRK